jgi:hypothetical protein
MEKTRKRKAKTALASRFVFYMIRICGKYPPVSYALVTIKLSKYTVIGVSS